MTLGGKPPSAAIPPGRVAFGDLRRLTPLSAEWGFDRGTPIDRHYIHHFLDAHASDISGHVLEVGDAAYTTRFGGARVTRSDVLSLTGSDAHTTIQADLTDAPHIPSNTFDCVIVTQTLQLIYRVPEAVATLHRIVRPGGRVLVTAPGITHTNDAAWSAAWCWSFTAASLTRLFTEAFGADAVRLTVFGNLLAAVGFLQGLAAEELTSDELGFLDPGYAVTLALRAVKEPGSTGHV